MRAVHLLLGHPAPARQRPVAEPLRDLRIPHGPDLRSVPWAHAAHRDTPADSLPDAHLKINSFTSPQTRRLRTSSSKALPRDELRRPCRRGCGRCFRRGRNRWGSRTVRRRRPGRRARAYRRTYRARRCEKAVLREVMRTAVGDKTDTLRVGVLVSQNYSFMRTRTVGHIAAPLLTRLRIKTRCHLSARMLHLPRSRCGRLTPTSLR